MRGYHLFNCVASDQSTNFAVQMIKSPASDMLSPDPDATKAASAFHKSAEVTAERGATEPIMLFIHPMWDNESQRIGKQKCTPDGYRLHVIAELLGFAGLLSLLAVMIFWGWHWINGTFLAALLWWAIAPVGLGLISDQVMRRSWRMAYAKGFEYDYDRREASWMEAGERRTYKYESSPMLTTSSTDTSTGHHPEH